MELNPAGQINLYLCIIYCKLIILYVGLELESNCIFIYISSTYLYNVLSVLCCVLENGATVLQVFFIEAECESIDLLETRIPKLNLLQVDQKVSVDWTTLNETHTAG